MYRYVPYQKHSSLSVNGYRYLIHKVCYKQLASEVDSLPHHQYHQICRIIRTVYVSETLTFLDSASSRMMSISAPPPKLSPKKLWKHTHTHIDLWRQHQRKSTVFFHHHLTATGTATVHRCYGNSGTLSGIEAKSVCTYHDIWFAITGPQTDEKVGQASAPLMPDSWTFLSSSRLSENKVNAIYMTPC